MAFEIKGHKCSKILKLCVPFFEFAHSVINSGIPNVWTFHKPIFDSNWMNISSTYFIYLHIFVFHWSIIDIVAELLFAVIYIMYPFLLFDTCKHNSSSSTQFLCTFMLQKFYWNVSVHPNFGYYRTKVMDSLHECFKAQMHPPETACQIHEQKMLWTKAVRGKWIMFHAQYTFFCMSSSF